MAVKIKVGRAASIALFAFLLFFLTSAAFTLARCQPIERDIEIDCKWKGEPISANLKWTESTENPTKISNADDGSKSKSGTTSSQASTVSNAQQALMLTGASAGAALAGGGLLVKKKLDGSSSSETKQTTSTSSTSSTVPKYTSDSARSYREGLEPHQDELKSSQGQSSAQTQQSSTQNPPKDNGLTPTASTLAASGATITKDLLMQKQMDSLRQSQAPKQLDIQKSEPDAAASTLAISTTATITRELLMQKQVDSLTRKSESSTTTQTGGTQQSEQAASPTPQNLGLLASSSSSAAQIATETWPQKQKEFERLAKQRADLAEKFSIPSYSTGLGLASSFTNATGNAWAKLHDFGSAIGNGIDRAATAVKPYATYVIPVVVAAIVVISTFLLPPAAPAVAGAGMGISVSQGVGLVGAGIIGGIGLYATHNIIMNYPQQPSFGTEHTQIIQQSTSEIKDEKGSGTYGEDVAQEQLKQAELTKSRIIEVKYQGSKAHHEAQDRCAVWLREHGVTYYDEQILQIGYDEERGIYHEFRVHPDFISDEYILDAKTGVEQDYITAFDQAKEYMWLAKQQEKRLVYIFRQAPKEDHWWNYIIDMLVEELGENFIVEYMGG